MLNVIHLILRTQDNILHSLDIALTKLKINVITIIKRWIVNIHNHMFGIQVNYQLFILPCCSLLQLKLYKSNVKCWCRKFCLFFCVYPLLKVFAKHSRGTKIIFISLFWNGLGYFVDFNFLCFVLTHFHWSCLFGHS